ncbi:hypothetical protein MLP_28020 [Microlunatus phosphovorus NM-1]|uniref:DUF1648 domain-containing protein n=1 Tax=Microlunatus phosphovorus (strain ATCC 700054 / DSM 10555 / JCM 9379 / NBRC 101784 / NCIMB 13414 / VKM Ac-1990 / NM-1) TaxID=1032480 RepID=F5XIE7_MICPN|nr:hypothetical protein [Microlunatus phosphovorus]BAK35816.1 hypothetical protein MLP_28020 [Microlunatus phosphovorus NM-1]
MVAVEDSSLLAGRVAFRMATAGYFALMIWQAFTLPDAVPGQLSLGGEVTRWGTRTRHVVLGLLVGLLVVVAFTLVPRIGLRRAALLNIPHKDYWTRAENLPAAQQLLRNDLGWLGAFTLVFVGYAMWTVGAVATAEPPHPWTFLVATGVFLALMIGYAIWMRVGPRWWPPVHRPY